MNKTMYLGAVALIVLTGPLAFADENGGEERGATVWDGFSGFLTPDWDRDFSVTLGTKVWLNEWSRDRAVLSNQGGFGTVIDGESGFLFASDTSPDAEESDIQPVPIPQLSVRYQWLVVTGSYYSKTRFEFGKSVGFLELLDEEGELIRELTTADLETSGERYEWDAFASIYVHPHVVILGGYKKVRQEIVTTLHFTDNTNPENNFDGREVTDIAIEGPIIGIAASVPIGGGFGMYGSYAHGFMDTDSRSVDDEGVVFDEFRDFNTTYNVAEVGFSYTHAVESLMPHLPLSAAAAYAGYRYQRISTDFGDKQDAGDVTEGFAVGVNLSF